MKRTSKEQTRTTDGSFTIKLGTTTYAIGIYLNDRSNAILYDNVKKLLAREVKEGAATNNTIMTVACERRYSL